LAAPQITKLQTDLGTLQATTSAHGTRLSNLETNAVAGQPATVDSGFLESEQHFVLSGNKIVPLIAGRGVRIDTVPRGLFETDYLLVSAQPWCSGYISDGGQKLSSHGQTDFVMIGSFGDKRQIQLVTAHPLGRLCTVSVAADFAGRSNTFVNYFAEGNPRIFTFFFSSNSSSAAAFRSFSFVIH
jgi:hypothetical protein